MARTETLDDAAAMLARAIHTNADMDRARRVDRGLDNAGNPIIDGRDFIELKSADGSLWRARMTNSGAWSIRKVTA